VIIYYTTTKANRIEQHVGRYKPNFCNQHALAVFLKIKSRSGIKNCSHASSKKLLSFADTTHPHKTSTCTTLIRIKYAKLTCLEYVQPPNHFCCLEVVWNIKIFSAHQTAIKNYGTENSQMSQ
jgi:hypothetical protein